MRARGWRRGEAGREPLAPEQIVLSLDPALSASLNRAAREQALTLNTVMQTAWGILLGRLSGRDDVVFGVTVAGGRRSLPASSTWWGCSSTRCRCGCNCRRSFRCRRCCGRPRTASRG